LAQIFELYAILGTVRCEKREENLKLENSRKFCIFADKLKTIVSNEKI